MPGGCVIDRNPGRGRQSRTQNLILKLVDQFSGPAKTAESTAEKFKREMQALNDIKSGSGKTWFDKATFDKASEALARRRRETVSPQKVEVEAARAIQGAERAKGESAVAAARRDRRRQ